MDCYIPHAKRILEYSFILCVMILFMCYVSYNIAVDEINWFEQSNRLSILTCNQ